MRFIIASTGRAGSKWCATVLRLQGIHCGHEQVFTTSMLKEMEAPDWNGYEGDSSLAAMPFLDTQEALKVMLVRHPLRTIESFLKAGPFLEHSQPEALINYLNLHTDVMESKNDTEAAAKYWLWWNTLLIQKCQAVVRIEELTPINLALAVGKTPKWEAFPIGSINATDDNLEIDWRNIPPKLRSKIKDLSHELGYV